MFYFINYKRYYPLYTLRKYYYMKKKSAQFVKKQ